MFGEVAEKLRRSTVRITSGSRRERGSGSGVVWTATGTVITNAHVVRNCDIQPSRDRPVLSRDRHGAEVEFWDGSKAEAVIAARDDRRDLARLETSVAKAPAAERRDSASLRPGEIVLAVGNPLGFVGALSTGIVHASRTIPGLGRQVWIQAAVRLAPGNSGGPLADAEGRVVGINTMVVGGGVALAVPSNAVVDFLSRPARPSLGVVVQPIAAQSGSAGLLVLRVASRGPASRASVLPGDLLIGANGRNFDSVDDLGDAIDRSAGGILRLQFLRGDRRASREVAIALPA